MKANTSQTFGEMFLALDRILDCALLLRNQVRRDGHVNGAYVEVLVAMVDEASILCDTLYAEADGKKRIPYKFMKSKP